MTTQDQLALANIGITLGPDTGLVCPFCLDAYGTETALEAIAGTGQDYRCPGCRRGWTTAHTTTTQEVAR